MGYIFAKIALFLAIIWAPIAPAVIPQNYPTDVGYKPVPHVIITAMPTEADSQQNAENSPLVVPNTPEVGVQAPEVAVGAPEVILTVPVAPGPAGTPVVPDSAPIAPVYDTQQGFGSHPFTEADFNK